MEKNKKIFSKILLFISLTVLLYTVYESEVKYNGDERNEYLKYYSVCFFLIFFSFVSLFLEKKTVTNIVTAFISIIFTIYLINGFFILQKKFKKNFDTRDKLEIYEDLKKTENNVTLSIYPREHEGNEDFPLFTVTSISNKKTIHCNESGKYSIHYTDRYGFNNPDKEWEKNIIEFLLIGDSFAHGACVNEPYTISGNLKKMIKSGGVLNLGHSSNGPLVEYVTLREYLHLKKTKRVLWIYYENDLPDLVRESKSKTLMEYLSNKNFTQNLPERQNEIDQKLEKEFENLKKEYIKNKKKEKGPIISFLRLYSLRSFIDQLLRKPPVVPIETVETFSEIISSAKELSNAHNAKFYFVYLPYIYRYKNKSNNNDQYSNYKDVIKIVEDLNIPVINIRTDLLDKHEDPLSLFHYRNSIHYTESGYKLLSESIFNKILKYEQ